MILTKFTDHLRFRNWKNLCFQILAVCVFACNKSANINANKTLISVNHIAYAVGPLSVELDKNALYTTPLSFGETTVNGAGGPYDTAVSQVSLFEVLLGSEPFLSGNQAFQQEAHYSVFIFDSLDQGSKNIMFLLDNPQFYADTLTNIRYLNFTPSSKIGLRICYNRDTSGLVKAGPLDTVNIGPNLFVGYDPTPSLYPFTNKIHVGTNKVYAFIDSARATIDSSNIRFMGEIKFDSTKNYNVFLQGFADSLVGINKFQLRTVKLN